METNENQPSTFSNQPRHQFCHVNYATYGQDSQNSSSFLAMETDDRSLQPPQNDLRDAYGQDSQNSFSFLAMETDDRRPQPPQNDLRDANQERKTTPNLQEDVRIEEMKKKIMTIPLYFASGKPGRVDPKMRRMPSNFLQRFAAAKNMKLNRICIAHFRFLLKQTFRNSHETELQ